MTPSGSRRLGAALLLCTLAGAHHAVEGSVQAHADMTLPVVMWHGMSDSCCASQSIGAVKQLIEDKLGVFVLSIATGSSEIADVWSSYFGDLNAQVAAVCEQLRSTPELQHGYNAVGFSQGGQFMRAVVQRCQHLGPKAKLLITMGAQHQGVMTIPGCDYASAPHTLDASGRARSSIDIGRGPCKTMQAILSKGAYLPFVQNRVVQAQYFKDPFHLEDYMKHGIFLPDVNNEHAMKSDQYRLNLLSLDKFVMYRFTDDKTVVPRDSSWFSFYNGTDLLPLHQQPLYTEDWLGLRELEQSGRLVYADAPGQHMQFTFQWFEEHVIDAYLAGGQAGGAAAIQR